MKPNISFLINGIINYGLCGKLHFGKGVIEDMKHVIKRISLILLFGVSLLLTSCKKKVWAIEKEIKHTAEQIIETIIDEDEEALFIFFASDIQDNRKDQTLEEIQQGFDFIDENIVSYDYYRGGGERRKSHGNIEYYNCHFEFRNVITEGGNTYTIECTYHYIWDSQPTREGITKIIIFKDNDRENQVQIGQNYDITE